MVSGAAQGLATFFEDRGWEWGKGWVLLWVQDVEDLPVDGGGSLGTWT